MKKHSLFSRKRQSETPGFTRFLKGPSCGVPNIDSDQLHAFIALAEELDFTRAVDRLHVAQPRFSKQITDLEEELRSQLFSCDEGRDVKLTNAGRVIVEEVRSALLHMERAFQGARAAQEKSDSALTIEHPPDAHQAFPIDHHRHLRPPRERGKQ